MIKKVFVIESLFLYTIFSKKVSEKVTLSLLFIGTIVMIVIMMTTGSSLKTTATPHGIIDLELAYSVTGVEAIINAWKPSEAGKVNNISVAKINTWLDFIFLSFYSLLLYTICKKISGSFKNGSRMQKAGNLFAYPILIAGFLDIAENIAMLQGLGGHISAGITIFTSIASLQNGC